LGWILLDSKTCEEVHTIPETHSWPPPTVFPMPWILSTPSGSSPQMEHIKSHKTISMTNNSSFHLYSSTVRASSSSPSTPQLRRCAVSLPLCPPPPRDR
jgi:hypothetical protein